jgi:hypothetical protein
MVWLPVACVGLALVALFIWQAYRREWRWTGFAAVTTTRPDEPTQASQGTEATDVQPAKTLWDWLQLLVIPLALAGLAVLLNGWQSGREQEREDRREEQQQAAAVDAAREEALRAYITQMSGLMLDRDLLDSRPRSDAATVASTATLTVLRRVDGERRGLVIRFLTESPLLARDEPIVDLEGADLRSAELHDAFLFDANFSDTNLSGADLSSAHLPLADFSEANLKRADLSHADIWDTDLSLADNLEDANLEGAAYDSETQWPSDFDPVAAGAKKDPQHRNPP